MFAFKKVVVVVILIALSCLVYLVAAYTLPENRQRKKVDRKSPTVLIKTMGNSNSNTNTQPSANDSLRREIETNIQNNDVMIFSKSFCPYCIRAKNAITALNVPFQAWELDTLANGKDIQAELHHLTGQRTVPNIFIKGQHLGGCDATLEAISTGKFQTMLGK